MLAPTIVTLTGASDDVDVNALVELSLEFPFIEWGILYSHKLSGVDPKYPSKTWIDNFADVVSKQTNTSHKHGTLPMNVAVHLCGGSVTDYISESISWTDQSMHNDMQFLYPFFNLDTFRLQLNFTLPHIHFDIDDLDSAISNELFDVITQHKPANASLLNYDFDANHQLLFDTSGGLGISPQSWPLQIPEKMCGYAGGIGPDNIIQVLDEVSKIAVTPYWIDMETKLRTDNKFDLEKCRFIAQTVERFMQL